MNANYRQIILPNTAKSKARRKRRDTMKQLASERGLIDKQAVSTLMELSCRQIERLIVLGRFPKPLKFDRYVRWRQSELQRWNAAGRPPNWQPYFAEKESRKRKATRVPKGF